MAVTAVTPIELEMNSASASTTDAAGGVVATTPADGWEIDAEGRSGDSLLLKFVAPSGATDTVVIEAGADWVHRSSLGGLSIAMTAGQVFYVPVESGRFVQAGGIITATCGHANTRCTAFVLPKGLGGSSR